MGHHSKRIDFQACERLQKMAAFGTSKHADKAHSGSQNATQGKIYSYSTMKTYKDCAGKFARWAASEHGCKNIDDAKQYAGEYLRGHQDAGLSAWSLAKETSALVKLYQCSHEDLGFCPPQRHRSEVTLHRTPGSPNGYSEARHQDIKEICQASGLRRHELAAMRPEDVSIRPNGTCCVYVPKGKGGRERYVECTNDAPARWAAVAVSEGRDRVIEHIPVRAPIHSYRQDYANDVYAQYARPISDLTPGDQYVCRGDLAGTVYDRNAMRVVSYNLGHSRLDVVTSYLKHS